jgi:hypothetical protein
MDEVARSAQELVDRLAITNVLLRYTHAVDSRDMQVIASCFTNEVELDVGVALEDGSTAELGVDAVLGTIRRLSRYGRTLHFIGQPMIRLDGDHAEVETSALVFLAGSETNPSGRVVIRGVRYIDHFIRQKGFWVISRRRHRAEWAGVFAAIGTEFPPNATPPWPEASE